VKAVDAAEVISVAEFRAAVEEFAARFGVDDGLRALGAATGGEIDLGRAEDRHALHRWLNGWGCRIRYPRAGEPDYFDSGIRSWWRRRKQALPGVAAPLAELSDDQIELVASAYADLCAVAVAQTANGAMRTLGPTAAAKSLFALRPRAVMPWDLMIATRLHGARDGDAFARHLRLGRSWARALLDGAGHDEQQLAAEVGQPSASLARLLDEYCYVRYTLGVEPSELTG